MSRHNYTQYANKANSEETTSVTEVVSYEDPSMFTVDENIDVPATPTAPVDPVIELVEETVETVTTPEVVTGVIVDCRKLNVRAEANSTADVVCVLDVNSEVMIDVAESTNEWFRICTATGVDGYCMRKYVNAHL